MNGIAGLGSSVVLGGLGALGSSAIWALASTFYTRISSREHPAAVNFFRARVALTCFFGLLVVQLGFDVPAAVAHLLLTPPEAVVWLLGSVIGSYVIGDYFFLMAAMWIGIPEALSVASCFPIWTFLADVVFFGHRATAIEGFGICIAVAGVITVVLTSRGAEVGRELRGSQVPAVPPSQPRIGWVFAGLTSLFWALNAVAVSRSTLMVDAATANIVRMGWGCLLIPIFQYGLTRGRRSESQPRIWLTVRDVRFVLPILILEVFGGSFLYVYGFKNAPLPLASTLSSLAPVLSVPFNWILGKESVGLLKFIGILATVGGISLLVAGSALP